MRNKQVNAPSQKASSELRLILGDQLNIQHSWFATPQPDVTFIMMEVAAEATYVTHHIQKIIAFFLAMREFAAQLVARGHQVIYLKLDDPKNLQSLDRNIESALTDKIYSCFRYQEPDEYRVDQLMRKLSKRILAAQLTQNVQMESTEHFLSARGELAEHFKGKKGRIMESFYRMMRTKHSVLLDPDALAAGKPLPLGGQWNFDAENRNRYDGKQQPFFPTPTATATVVQQIVALLSKQGIPTMGTVDPTTFIWPTTRAQALEALERFVKEHLPYFGRYQDAMDTKHPFLFHSLLSFPLNVKLISPREVIDRAVAAFEAAPDLIPLSAVEGFVRQILGWREYMRGLYWEQMPEFASLNFFSNDRPLPTFFWDGNTKMNCLSHTINQSLAHAYAHHIQRLMVTGSFALLAGINPDEVDRWYLGIYIDALEWVEITNTRGMSQYADGGIVATKPYCGSANYMKKMSNYCSGCYYDSEDRTGPKSCPFNSLYWDFHDRNREKLKGNHRIGMTYRTLDRMEKKELVAIRKRAAQVLNDLNSL